MFLFIAKDSLNHLEILTTKKEQKETRIHHKCVFFCYVRVYDVVEMMLKKLNIDFIGRKCLCKISHSKVHVL